MKIKTSDTTDLSAEGVLCPCYPIVGRQKAGVIKNRIFYQASVERKMLEIFNAQSTVKYIIWEKQNPLYHKSDLLLSYCHFISEKDWEGRGELS